MSSINLSWRSCSIAETSVRSWRGSFVLADVVVSPSYVPCPIQHTYEPGHSSSVITYSEIKRLAVKAADRAFARGGQL